MDLKDIQELIKFVAKSGATEVDLEIDNVKISIKSPAKKRRGSTDEVKTIIQQAPIPQAPSANPKSIVSLNSSANKKEVIAQTEDNKETKDEDNYITIKASMIGTFYRAVSPDSPPLVNVGDSIKTGDVLCVIEAMKLFNEIESDISGKIIKVLVDDATPIEFDQPLFLVDPS